MMYIDNVSRTMRHEGSEHPIHWKSARSGLTHACETTEVHRDRTRLVWTLCNNDVPADAGYLPIPAAADPVTCGACRAALAAEEIP